MMLKRLVTLVFVLVLAACSKEEAKKSDVELKEVDLAGLLSETDLAEQSDHNTLYPVTYIQKSQHYSQFTL